MSSAVVGPGATARPAVGGGVRRAPLAIVQHGHQYLITDGYDSREGLSEIVASFSRVLAIHLRYRVPLNLHLSGTLVEAIAWRAPDFFEWVRALRADGLLEVIGSAYAQSILTLFSKAHGRLQLVEALRLCQDHLDVDPAAIRGCWVPERVWDTGRVAPVVGDPELPNGGYSYVLLDDRLAYPLDGNYDASERRRFDLRTAPGRGAIDPTVTEGWSVEADDRRVRPFRIEGAGDLVAVPICGDLRYSVPPRHPEHWDNLRAILAAVASTRPGAIAVYADDLEKTAAIGPWAPGSWSRPNIAPYEAFIAWLADSAVAQPVLISRWLDEQPPMTSRPVDTGTFYELAHSMRAGEDYAGWWGDPAWAAYREVLMSAERLLLAEARGSKGGLWDLAWKHLMASSCETGWQVADGSAPSPAPWSRALANHARSVFVIAAAARWLEARDGKAHVTVVDVDGDGRDEVVLKNDRLFGVVTPDFGGRLVYLFDLGQDGGRLVVGNHADDWNWQEDVNRFMRTPPNHPGAFADLGHEDDQYRVEAIIRSADDAGVLLVDREPGSAIHGAAKRYRIEASSTSIEVAYLLPGDPEAFTVVSGLSPDYLALLRVGRQGVRIARLPNARGCATGPTSVWVRRPQGEPVLWGVPNQEECGHAILVTAVAYRRAFRLELGVGSPARSDSGPSSAGGVESRRRSRHDRSPARRLPFARESAEPAGTGSAGAPDQVPA
jgi:hypothetical protein